MISFAEIGSEDFNSDDELNKFPPSWIKTLKIFLSHAQQIPKYKAEKITFQKKIVTAGLFVPVNRKKYGKPSGM